VSACRFINFFKKRRKEKKGGGGGEAVSLPPKEFVSKMDLKLLSCCDLLLKQITLCRIYVRKPVSTFMYIISIQNLQV